MLFEFNNLLWRWRKK